MLWDFFANLDDAPKHICEGGAWVISVDVTDPKGTEMFFLGRTPKDIIEQLDVGGDCNNCGEKCT